MCLDRFCGVYEVLVLFCFYSQQIKLINPLTPIVTIWNLYNYKASCARPG